MLLIRSCGGDDEPTPVTPVAGATGIGGATVLAQSDYIDQADAICLEANTSLANVDETDAAAGGHRHRPRSSTSELQQLQTPAAARRRRQTSSTTSSPRSRPQATAYQDQATALERGDDAAAVAELDATIDEAATEAADAADAFGFKVCGDLSKVGESDSRWTTDSAHRRPTPAAPRRRPSRSSRRRPRRRPPVTATADRHRHRDARRTAPTDTGGTRLQLRRRQSLDALGYAAADSAQVP